MTDIAAADTGSTGHSQGGTGAPNAPAPDLVRAFVEHWGVMARAWGINPTMGELFATLYITGTEWTAEQLRDYLRISRGNVSMNLRELLSWGVVHKAHRQGERKEYFRAEGDVWTLFHRILLERKRRELDPTLDRLDQITLQLNETPGFSPIQNGRLAALRQFLHLVNQLATHLSAMSADDLQELLSLLKEMLPPRP